MCYYSWITKNGIQSTFNKYERITEKDLQKPVIKSQEWLLDSLDCNVKLNGYSQKALYDTKAKLTRKSHGKLSVGGLSWQEIGQMIAILAQKIILFVAFFVVRKFLF